MASQYDKNFDGDRYLMNYSTRNAPPSMKNTVLQFRIELTEIEPKIWRRIQIKADSNFWDLHVAIQDAMGWWDAHLHHFEIKGKRKKKMVSIGIPDFSRSGDLPEVFPGWEIPVTDHFNDLGVTAMYEYDYGDSWIHSVQLEGYLLKDKSVDYPVCMDGARACPPEDCGGVYGYHENIRIMHDPGDDEYDGTITWLDGWHPEKFEKEKIEFCNPYERWVMAFL